MELQSHPTAEATSLSAEELQEVSAYLEQQALYTWLEQHPLPPASNPDL